MIRKFELESVANSAPKLQWEGTGKGMALSMGGEALFFCNKECGDGDEISLIFSQVGK